MAHLMNASMAAPANNMDNNSKISPHRQDAAPPGVMQNTSFSSPQQHHHNAHQVAVSGSISSKDSLGSPGSNGSPIPFHPVRGSFAGAYHMGMSADGHHNQRVGDFTPGGQYPASQDAFCTPTRNAPAIMEGCSYPPQQYSPYASPPPARRLYPETNPPPPQPMRYTSGPPHDSHPPPPPHYHPYPPYPPPPPPPHYPMMAPTPSSDSSYSAAYPPYPYPVHHHASFESHASAASTTTNGPPTPYMTYSYPPAGTTTVIAYPHYHHHPPPWAMPPKIEYISKIEPEDVLCGRGGATNSHSGNRAFRLLVKRHQDGYLKAKKRDKPSVATRIVELVRERGGRFLRRCAETSSPSGNVLWVDIGDDRAREKTAQALREGAPEIRRRKSKSFEEKTKRKDSDGEESSTGGDTKDDDDFSSPRKPAKRVKEELVDSRNDDDKVARTPTKSDTRDDNEDGCNGSDSPTAAAQDGKDPPVIRPSARLMKRSTTTEITMAELTSVERELYLRDFLPPNTTTKNSKLREVVRVARHYTPVAEGDDDSVMDKEEDDDEWAQEE